MADPTQNHPSEACEETDDFRPWEEHGNVRRDCEPHRAGFLKLSASLAFLLGLLSLPSCMVVMPALVGLMVGGTVYVLARQDLSLIDRRLMDPEGGVVTAEAKENAGCGMLLSLASLCGWGILLAMGYFRLFKN